MDKAGHTGAAAEQQRCGAVHDGTSVASTVQRPGALPVARLQGAHDTERMEWSRHFIRWCVPAKGRGEATVLGVMDAKQQKRFQGREQRGALSWLRA